MAFWRGAEGALLLALQVYDCEHFAHEYGRAAETLARVRAKLNASS